jgi:hypothetical protein
MVTGVGLSVVLDFLQDVVAFALSIFSDVGGGIGSLEGSTGAGVGCSTIKNLKHGLDCCSVSLAHREVFK